MIKYLTHPSTSATPSYIESCHFQPERLNGNRVIQFSIPKSVKITKSRVGQNRLFCISSPGQSLVHQRLVHQRLVHQSRAGDQYMRNLGLPRPRKWDLGRIGWAKVMEGMLKVEVWTGSNHFGRDPKMIRPSPPSVSPAREAIF